ncbi:hypothetical protein NB693_24750 [Pantoea ananatis]|uniref:hypothetical protein n=1 Tax=Pantoea ananas TaxID=553 RepID=UPI002220CE5A|nr:hypothetical protein [Pantoea ananatis]
MGVVAVAVAVAFAFTVAVAVAVALALASLLLLFWLLTYRVPFRSGARSAQRGGRVGRARFLLVTFSLREQRKVTRPRLRSSAAASSRAKLSPGGELLFFACAKKSNQKKAHPASRPPR